MLSCVLEILSQETNHIKNNNNIETALLIISIKSGSVER